MVPVAGIGCVLDQVEIDSEIIDVLVTNEELSVVDSVPTNEGAAVHACSARRVPALTTVIFGGVIRLLISRVSALYCI